MLSPKKYRLILGSALLFITLPYTSFAANVFLGVGQAFNFSNDVSASPAKSSSPGATTISTRHTNDGYVSPLITLGYGMDLKHWQYFSLDFQASLNYFKFKKTIAPFLQTTAVNSLDINQHYLSLNGSLDLLYHFNKRFASGIKGGLALAEVKSHTRLNFLAAPLSAYDQQRSSQTVVIPDVGLLGQYQLNTHFFVRLGIDMNFIPRVYLGNFYSNPPVSAGTDISTQMKQMTTANVSLHYQL